VRSYTSTYPYALAASREQFYFSFAVIQDGNSVCETLPNYFLKRVTAILRESFERGMKPGTENLLSLSVPLAFKFYFPHILQNLKCMVIGLAPFISSTCAAISFLTIHCRRRCNARIFCCLSVAGVRACALS
jgi:hypothetical protein